MKKTFSIILATFLLLSSLLCNALAEGVTIIGSGDNGNETCLGGEQELKPGDKIKVDGEYSITFSQCTMNGQNRILNGRYYTYLTSKENGAVLVRYEHQVGTHTPAELVITLTNRSKQSVNWQKRVKCTVIFDDLYTFDTMATQWNPDQTDSNGNTCDSTDFADIEPLVSVDIGFIFAVPYIVRDSDRPLVAYVSVDNDTYAIDLRKNMVINND